MPADLAELRRLHEAAEPEHQIFATGDGGELATDLVIGDSVYGPIICSFDLGFIHDDHEGGWTPERMNAYARVLAAARNALPELLDEVERLSQQWTCFHCGFQTSDRTEAAAHFGEMGEEEEPLCLTWKDLDEHGKASELQNALGQLAEANAEIERLRAENAALQDHFEKVAEAHYGDKKIADAARKGEGR